MAGRSWLVDGNRFATKIMSASGSCDPERFTWKSNPTRACPNCHNLIDNSDVAHEWPGLPRGVKFDPSDQEIVWHLLAKVGIENIKPHPFIDEFIPTVDKDDGICYTHPQKLPGARQDGSVSLFFHRAINAYNTGTRKRRKIQGDNIGDVRWHKTGRTKPVILDGVHRGCKKIMVLYLSPSRGAKPEKTSWVMHQYHLGTGEDEKDGEYVVSKIFSQQQQAKQGDKNELEPVEGIDPMITKVIPVTPESRDKNELEYVEGIDAMITKVIPVTPKSVTPDPPCSERRRSGLKPIVLADPSAVHHDTLYDEDVAQAGCEELDHDNRLVPENHTDQMTDHGIGNHGDQTTDTNDDNNVEEDPKWWEDESQYLLDSQQLVEGLSLCDDLLQSQSPRRDENRNESALESKPRLSDYAQLGSEHLKKDLEACQSLILDPENIELDTPPEFRLSQLDFGSQESFTAWGGSKMI